MESFAAIEKINSTQNLSVRDFEGGNINLDDVMEEVNYLKNQITVIRQEMAAFLTGIATIGPTTRPQQVFEENTQRVTALQKTLDDYVERYKRLTPLLELVNQDLKLQVPPKQEPQIKPPTAPLSTANTPNNSNNNNNGGAGTQKKQPLQRKRTYNKKSQNNQNNQNPPPAPINKNAPILPNANNGNAYQAGMLGFPAFQANKEQNSTEANGSETQPIML